MALTAALIIRGLLVIVLLAVRSQEVAFTNPGSLDLICSKCGAGYAITANSRLVEDPRARDGARYASRTASARISSAFSEFGYCMWNALYASAVFCFWAFSH